MIRLLMMEIRSNLGHLRHLVQIIDVRIIFLSLVIIRKCLFDEPCRAEQITPDFFTIFLSIFFLLMRILLSFLILTDLFLLRFRLFNLLDNRMIQIGYFLTGVDPFRIVDLLLFDELFVFVDFISLLELLAKICDEIDLTLLELLDILNFIL